MSSRARVSPPATEAWLVLVLAVTLAGVLSFAVAASGEEVDHGAAGALLWLFLGLFLGRVSGQVLVLLRSPGWLPPMDQWNLMPYRFLLPVQLVLIGLMSWIAADLTRGRGVFAEPVPAAGSALVWLAYVYAGATAVRYAVRMRRRPDQRWAGGAIPIVFHLVLAAFVFTYGSFHASA